MNIGFDAKRAVQNFTGLGNYSRFVINNLAKYYPNNTYKLFSPKPIQKRSEITTSSNISFIIKQGFKPLWRTIGVVNDVQKANIDIYHGLSGELPYNINKTGVKTVVTIHDLIFLKYPQFYPLIDRKIYNAKAKYACKVADKIIAISECTKKDIIENYGINPVKIEVVYQGCFSIFKKQVDEEQKRETRKKYNLPDNFLLSIGSIEDRKNILLIVKALKNVPDIHFVAIGKQQKYTETVKKYIQENNLEDRVHILSGVPLNDLPTILQSSKIFIYPSLYEGFGIPIIEALSSGVPVIATTGSCLEEAGGPHSIYINPSDEKELALQINKVLNDEFLQQKMIDEGLEYVKQFSDEKCSERLMKVYEGLV